VLGRQQFKRIDIELNRLLGHVRASFVGLVDGGLHRRVVDRRRVYPPGGRSARRPACGCFDPAQYGSGFCGVVRLAVPG